MKTESERILLVVTGLSPQVVTETLYALAVQAAPAWIPTRVYIITTREGAERARLALFSDDPGWFARLCRDHDLPQIAFGPKNILTVPDAQGRPLDDIRSPEDNECAADFITHTIRRFTEDATSALHVSIAGGRKTMGYYLGYALSLYGRAQDSLSHVLVNEPFESSWDFFYPTPYSRVITTRDNKLADTREARVTLAEIPFVRLRDGLPQGLLNGNAPFSQVVNEAQRALPPISLRLTPATRQVTAGGETFTLKPSEFAFYWLFVARAQAGQPGLHWSDAGIGAALLGYYRQLVKPASAEYERAEQAYRNLSKDNFDPAKTHLHKAIVAALGERRAQPYLLHPTEAIPGSRYRRHALTLPPAAITIAASLRGQQGREGR